MAGMTVRADEVTTGDDAAVKGIVGEVTYVHRWWNDPRVTITVRSEWGAEATDTFHSEDAVRIERH